MQPLSVLGPDAATLVDALAARVDGRVAVVDEAAAEATGRSATATTVSLADDGTWSSSGSDADFTAMLDRLAPDHDYLFATGFSRLRVPTVLIGDDRDPDDVPGDVVLTADAAADVPLDELVAVLDDAEPWITREALVERATSHPDADYSGAVATFTGRVRAKENADDDRTTHLAFEKYEGVAEERMNAIAETLEERDGVLQVLMHHRTGVIEDGEDIVFVVVLAAHRKEAFRAVEDGIDRLKDAVPIFKKETTEAEQFWVHQRE